MLKIFNINGSIIIGKISEVNGTGIVTITSPRVLIPVNDGNQRGIQFAPLIGAPETMMVSPKMIVWQYIPTDEIFMRTYGEAVTGLSLPSIPQIELVRQ